MSSNSGTGVPSFSPSPAQFIPLVKLGYVLVVNVYPYHLSDAFEVIMKIVYPRWDLVRSPFVKHFVGLMEYLGL